MQSSDIDTELSRCLYELFTHYTDNPIELKKIRNCTETLVLIVFFLIFAVKEPYVTLLKYCANCRIHIYLKIEIKRLEIACQYLNFVFYLIAAATNRY